MLLKWLYSSSVASLGVGVAATDADSLIASYNNAIGLSSDDGSGNTTYSVKDSDTPANNVSNGDPQDVFTNTTTSPKLCLQSDSTYDWSLHEFANNSRTLSSHTRALVDYLAPTFTAQENNGSHYFYTGDTVAADNATRLKTIAYRVEYNTAEYVGIRAYQASAHWVHVTYNMNSGGTPTVSQESEGGTGGTIVDSGVYDYGDGTFALYVTFKDVVIAGASSILMSFHSSATPTIISTFALESWTVSGDVSIDVTECSCYYGPFVARPNNALSTTTSALYGVSIDYDQGQSAYTILHEPTATNVLATGVPDSFSGYTNLANFNISNVSGPIGSVQALNISANTTTAGVHRTCTISANTNACAWALLKSDGTCDYAYIRNLNFALTNQVSYFNLSTGAVHSEATDHTASITDIGNGWYLCQIVFDPGADAAGNIQYGPSSTGSALNVASGVGLNIAHVQCEVGSAPTSPIPTFGSTVTRDQDELEIDLTALHSDAATVTDLSFMLDFELNGTLGAGNDYFAGLFTSGTKYTTIRSLTSNGRFRLTVTDTTTQVALNNATSMTGDTRLTGAIRFDTNDTALSYNSETTVSDTTCSVITYENFSWGGQNATTNKAPFPVRLYNMVLTYELLNDAALEAWDPAA